MVICQSIELGWEVTVELLTDSLSIGRGFVRHNKAKHKQPKTWSLNGSGTLWNYFSNEEPIERPTLGIQLIK